VKTVSGDEILHDESEIASIPRKLKEHPNFVPGPSGSLLAFGSHCDLFRTPALFTAFLSTLQAVAPLGNPIQVSTKQVITSRWAAKLSAARTYGAQIVVFISCSTVLQSTVLEPRTASPQARFTSFDALRAHTIPACLYIKPFLPGITDGEVQGFLEVIRAKQPDAVCAGVLYVNKRVAEKLKLLCIPELSYGRHPLMTYQMGAVYPTPELLRVLEEALPSTPIFRNSACVVAYINGIHCPIHVWEHFPELCVACQDCESTCQKAEAEVKYRAKIPTTQESGSLPESC
jgi:DNA repair photolyase